MTWEPGIPVHEHPHSRFERTAGPMIVDHPDHGEEFFGCSICDHGNPPISTGVVWSLLFKAVSA